MEENQCGQNYKCDDQITFNQINFVSHEQPDPGCYTGEIVDGPTSAVIICKFCKEEFDNRQSLERHYTKHMDLRPWECRQCDKNFKRRDHLNRHINCVHGGDFARKYKCPYPGCNSPGYCESYHLQRHIEAVHEKLECNMCLSTFGKKCTLEAHLVECHGVDPPFVCVVCQAFFFREKSFENHIKRHELSRPINSRNLNVMYKEKSCNNDKEDPEEYQFEKVKEELPVHLNKELKDHNSNIKTERDDFSDEIKKEKQVCKRNYLENYVSKPKVNTYENKNCYDSMLVTEETIRSQLNSSIMENTKGLSISRETLFGYPYSTGDGPAFSKPTTSLFDELLESETFVCKDENKENSIHYTNDLS